MADNYDQLALKWVREEVNKTLDQARQALEAFAENAEDATQIQFCANCLHQVRGTLTMLEFYGAALFAEEMEALADAIAKGGVKNPPRAQEILMGTILQLPTYLERVQAGRRDLPVVLLPLLNDLRASRGETLLSESSIFTPNLQGVKMPMRSTPPDAPKNDAEFRDQAKKLRHHYQRGLLGVFRNQEISESLTRLLKVVERFETINAAQPIGLLWWVGAGFVEAIAENGIYKNAGVHALLGQIDKYIKQMGDEGDIAAFQEPPQDLLKNLLYYVACSERKSPRLDELRDAYQLRDALPSADEIESERKRMTGTDATAIRTVLQALNEDLAGVKDGLDLYVRSKHKNPQDLLNLLPTLRQIADTLAMLGLGVPRDAVRQQVHALQRVADSGETPSEMHVMDIAGALLFVEANLATVAQNAAQMAAEETHAEAPAAQTEDEIAAEAQFDSARVTLINECRGNLQKCKDAIIDFMASQWDHRLIEAVPNQLVEVEGGLHIIGLPEAADMVKTCHRFLAERVVNPHAVPETALLDALADVLTSIEYFLESMQDAGGLGLESVLSAAREPTNTLAAEMHKPLPAATAPVAAAAPVIKPNESDVIRNADIDEPVTSVVSAAPTTPVPVVSTPATTTTPPTATAPAYAPSIQRPSNDTVDDEVIEIFIEEAAEQLDVIRECLPQWIANENDRESLTTIRRAFHTLKGSGRLVGAKLLGETAWTIENMLNRVLDNTIAASPAVHNVVREAAEVIIPHLRECFAAQHEPTIRPENMMARAEALSKGESIDFVPPPVLTPLAAPAAPEISEPAVIADAEGHLSFAETEQDHILEPVEVIDVIEPIATIDAIGTADTADVVNELPEMSAADIDEPLELAIETPVETQSHRAAEDLEVSSAIPVDPLLAAMGSAPMDPVMATIDEAPVEPLMTEAVTDTDFGDMTTTEFAATEDFGEFALPAASADELHNLVIEETPDLSAEFEASMQAASAPAPVAAEPVVHEEIDNTLLDIFAGEAGSHLDTIDRYLTDAALSPFSPKISDELIRALHTLKGSAKMAGLDAIGDVMLPLEKHVRDVQQHDASVSADTLTLLTDTSLAVRHGLQQYEQHGSFEFGGLAPLIERAQFLASEADHLDATRNPEILQLFMSEAMDVLSDIDLNIRSWQLDAESNNGSILADLFSMLQQAATTANVPAFANLAHHGAQLFERAQQHQVEEQLFTLGMQVHDQLIDMLDRLAADQHVHQADDLIAQLALWPSTPAEDDIELIEELPAVAESAPAVPSFDAETIVADLTPVAVVETPETVFETEPELTLPDVATMSEVVSPVDDTSIATKVIGDNSVRSFDSDFESQEFVVAPLPTALPVYSADDKPHAITVDADGEEILQIFMEEADDILSALDEALEGWSAAPDDKATVASLQRYLHTLKGGARLSDLTELGNLSHEFENLFEAMAEGRAKVTPALIRVAQEGRDRLADLVNEVREKRTQTKPSLYWQRLNLAIQGHDPYADVAAFSETPTVHETAAPAVKATPVTPAATPVEAAAAPAAQTNVVPFTAKERSESPLDKPQEKPQSAQIEYIRVPADRLEGLVNLAGESSIFRGRIEQQMTVVRHNLQEMEQTVARLREQLRQLEAETEAQVQARREVVGETYADFDPLEFDRYTRQQELSRALGESAGDLLNLKESLDNLAADAETLLLQQGRVNSELHDSLIRSRMVPFSSLVPRLKRMVRQIGDELGKGVEISIFAEGEMDRTVLERMVAPIEHMMRNAIDHGIERPEKRIAANKPQTGRIRIRLTREGNEVIIEIQDDGAGINTAAIRRKAIERGLITESTKLTEHELMLLIFEAGFSTAETVTQISGRGVGMDVVASEIKTLGGRIDIDSEIGKGSRFTVRLPFTVSVNQALMVQVGEDILAIPLANIEGIVRISPYELQTYYENGELRYEYAGQPYRMRYLGTLLDHNVAPRFEGVYKPVPILLLHGTEQPVALHVDELLGSREVVVKTVGSLLSTISGLSGATILGDGRVVLILDLPALLRRADATQVADVEEVHVETEMPLALVVDDSVTVRKVTGRLLERSGYRVETAKDGVDAVNVLHDIVPDIMLLDIEMPRMDGFELANIVRHDERLKHVPIIMITSRTGDKHRSRAMEIGVDRYLGKPFNDVELLSTMQELLDSKK